MDAIYKKLNGYQRHLKGRHLVAKELELTNSEYRVWDLLGAVCGWDKKHPHLYKKVRITLRELSIILNCHETNAGRAISSLIGKGLVIRMNRGEYEIKILCQKGTEVEDNEELAKLQEKPPFSPAKLPEHPALSQDNQGYSSNSSLVSYKNNSSLRTYEEYLRIWREMGYVKDFDVNDVKFIDQAIYEETGVGPN